MPVDRGIVVANHRHEVIGVAEHLLDRGGRERVRRLPIVPLKGVELLLDDGARAGGGQILRGGAPVHKTKVTATAAIASFIAPIVASSLASRSS